MIKTLRTFTTNVNAIGAVVAPAALATYCLSHAQPRSLQSYIDGALNLDHWVCLEALLMFVCFVTHGHFTSWFCRRFLNMPRTTFARRPVRMLITLTFMWLYISHIRPELFAHEYQISVMGFTHGESPVNGFLTPYIAMISDFVPYTQFLDLGLTVWLSTLLYAFALHFCNIATTFACDIFQRVVDMVMNRCEKLFPGWLHIDLCDYFTGVLNLFSEFLAWILADLTMNMACTFVLGGNHSSTEFDFWMARAALAVIRAIPHISYTTKTVRKNTTPRAKRTVVAAAPKEE